MPRPQWRQSHRIRAAEKGQPLVLASPCFFVSAFGKAANHYNCSINAIIEDRRRIVCSGEQESDLSSRG
jgi:hypothetical protein